MKKKILSTEALSTYCSSLAMLLGAGVQTEEAVAILCSDAQDDEVLAAAQQVQTQMTHSGSLAAAIGAVALFPPYMQQMVAAGELSGRTEPVLHRLADYYEDQTHMEQRLRSAVLYPTVLLLVMSMILLFMLCKVLPVFTAVYENLAGGITAGSYTYINLAYVLGWLAFGVTLLFGAGVLAAWMLWKNGRCHAGFTRLLSRWHISRAAAQQTALAQFTTALATYIASGTDTDTAAAKAQAVVMNAAVEKKIAACRQIMAQGKSFIQAAQAQKLYTPLHMRMLASGMASGKLEQALADLSRRQWESAQDTVRGLTDAVEPVLAALLTVSVGLLLVAVMLPLIGIMGSIG